MNWITEGKEKGNNQEDENRSDLTCIQISEQKIDKTGMGAKRVAEAGERKIKTTQNKVEEIGKARKSKEEEKRMERMKMNRRLRKGNLPQRERRRRKRRKRLLTIHYLPPPRLLSPFNHYSLSLSLILVFSLLFFILLLVLSLVFLYLSIFLFFSLSFISRTLFFPSIHFLSLISPFFSLFPRFIPSLPILSSSFSFPLLLLSLYSPLSPSLPLFIFPSFFIFLFFSPSAPFLSPPSQTNKGKKKRE